MSLVFRKYQNNFEFVSIVKIFKRLSCVIFYHDRYSVFFAYTNSDCRNSLVYHLAFNSPRTSYLRHPVFFRFPFLLRCWVN